MEWFVVINPDKDDTIDNLKHLITVNLKRDIDVAVDDVVYIYLTGDYRTLKYKCRVSKVDLELMALELIEELDSPLYSYERLSKYGFIILKNQNKLLRETKVYLDLVQKLKKANEMNFDEHDGSYELVRETINAYANMKNLEYIDYRDLNLVYLMCVGTWRHSVDVKKRVISDSHLPELEKERLNILIDKLWHQAKNGYYTNQLNSGPSIGMFGTGFYSFEGKTDINSPRNFIQMCIDIKDEENDDIIFNRCKEVLNIDFKGMKAASASMILHCLKPMAFPIFNSNMGSGNIFSYLGVELKSKYEIYTYIDNVQLVKKFRDSYFNIKNYRIFDQLAYLINTDIDYLGVLSYLEKYAGVPYSNPNNKDLDATKKAEYNKIKNESKKAVSQMKKMVELCKQKFGLDYCEPIIWLDGSYTKTKRYLWAQMKYKEYDKYRESISISVEKPIGAKHAKYRFVLELKDLQANSEDLEKYHKHLELPTAINSKLVFLLVSNELNEAKILDEDISIIREKVQNGTYQRVQRARVIEWSEDLTNEEIEQAMLEAVEELIPYYDYVIGKRDLLKEDKLKYAVTNANINNFDKNMILYGPPGTGKTYNSVIYAVAICDNLLLEKVKKMPYESVIKRYNELKEKENRIAFTTFHQSYGYEEFIEGIKPKMNNCSEDISYEIKDGIFKSFCNIAYEDKKRRPYVFVIDEINRGNISKIFGELITLIETTKRKNAKEAMEAILPYSNNLFSVPDNVYIIGTMNTADRSIALLDTALRRRFQFEEMMPDSQVLVDIGAGKIVENGYELDVAKMLNCINQRIEFLYDREHTIGHAFFVGLKDDPTISKLSSIFKKSIIPLLQEYFYEDYSKIMMILGDNGKINDEHKFVLETTANISSIFKGDISQIDVPEYLYKIQLEAFDNIMSYIEIEG